MNDHIFAQAEKLQKKYRTRDPFELLEAMNVIVMFSDSYSRDGLKGFCTIQHKTKYVVINGRNSVWLLHTSWATLWYTKPI